jgi:hypothetical protein
MAFWYRAGDDCRQSSEVAPGGRPERRELVPLAGPQPVELGCLATSSTLIPLPRGLDEMT